MMEASASMSRRGAGRIISKVCVTLLTNLNLEEEAMVQDSKHPCLHRRLFPASTTGSATPCHTRCRRTGHMCRWSSAGDHLLPCPHRRRFPLLLLRPLSPLPAPALASTTASFPPT